MIAILARHRLLAAVVSGAALAFALPTVFPIVGRAEILPGGALTVLAYVALAPLLVAVEDAGPRARFGLGVLSGLGYYTIAIWWIYVAMHTFGGIPTALSVPILYLLLGYLSVYWGLALVIDHDVRRRFPALPQWLTLGTAFVGGELVRNYLFSGYPWANVGYLLARDRTEVQWASLFGVYGLAFLVVVSNAALAQLWRGGAGKRTALLALGAVLVVPRLWGLYRLSAIDAQIAAAPKVKVAIVQGNIDQKIKNAAKGGQLDFGAYRDFVLGRYLPLSREADAAGVDVILWPEASYPGYLPLHPTQFPDVLGPPLRAPVLIGGVTGGRQPNGRLVLTNSAFLIGPERRVLAEYDKHHLVPFGEYVPLEKELHLPIHKVVPDVGFFDPGEHLNVLQVGEGERAATFGPMICFDAIFPEIGVEFGREEPEFLVNVTNDAWYGISSAAYQFLSIVSLRAVETGRAFARAANTGISAVIDPAGRILASLPIGLVDSDEADLSTDRAIPPASLVAELPKLHGRTPYVVIGDAFAYLCTLFALALWFIAKREPNAPSKKATP